MTGFGEKIPIPKIIFRQITNVWTGFGWRRSEEQLALHPHQSQSAEVVIIIIVTIIVIIVTIIVAIIVIITIIVVIAIIKVIVIIAISLCQKSN